MESATSLRLEDRVLADAAPSLDPCGPAPDERQLGDRIFAIHRQLASFCPTIRRLAVALHEPATGAVKTFLQSTDGGDPLRGYERPLREVPSLVRIAQTRSPRVIDDLSVLAGSPSEHSRWVLSRGYQSSYTVPLFANSHLLGFLFFDADNQGAFSAPVRSLLSVYSQLIALLVAHERATVNTLLGAVRTAIQFSRFRDEETGEHLSRVSHYAGLIAHALPPAMLPGDEWIEYLVHFAPLHDLGKIATPDGILRKPGPLAPEEIAVMRRHVVQGAELIDTMIREFGLGELHHVDMLRNVILYHHENFDGTGYAAGLAGEAIPLEGRITKVADVFDALTSRRPYKRAWTLDEAFANLREGAGTQFDPHCVDALLGRRAEVEAVRERFADAPAAD